MMSFGFTSNRITEIITTSTSKKSLDKYMGIMNSLFDVDIIENQSFQKQYNGYYRMRQRSKEYYFYYFKFLEEHKYDKDLLFRDVVTYLYDKTNRCELSFASKLLATVNPEYPVWDKYVAKEHFGISYSQYTPRKYPSRIDYLIAKYEEFCNQYLEYMKSDEANLIVETFKKEYEDIHISEVKMVDLVLWQDR